MPSHNEWIDVEIVKEGGVGAELDLVPQTRCVESCFEHHACLSVRGGLPVRIDCQHSDADRLLLNLLQLRAQLVIFLLELAKVLRKLLVGLKSAYRFRQIVQIDRGTNAYEEDGAVPFEGAPGFEDFRFCDRGGNRSDFQRTGLRASPTRFFFYIVKWSFKIDARLFRGVALGLLENFFFCAGQGVAIGHDILAIGDDGFRGGTECRSSP